MQECALAAPVLNRDKRISMELISALVGLILTLMVFSYLIKDNPLFRIAVYLFIGAASGYSASVVLHYVILPRLSQSLTTLNPLLLIPLIFGISLFAKFFPRISWLGNFAMAVLVGVGAAGVVGGALLGTLMPQAQAAINGFDVRSAGNVGVGEAVFQLLEGGVMLVGTVFTLASFHFSAGRAADNLQKWLAKH